MNQYKIILFILLFFPLSMQGQGFLGRTFTLSPHFSAIYFGNGAERFNPSLNLDIEKAFGRANSLGLSLNRLPNGHTDWTESPTAPATFQGQGVGAFYKRYLIGRGAIAPIGPWFQIGGTLQNYTITNEDTQQFYDNVRTFSIRSSVGLNFVISKYVFLFMAVEGKYETLFESEFDIPGRSFNVLARFNRRISEVNPVNVKLGITIPIL